MIIYKQNDILFIRSVNLMARKPVLHGGKRDEILEFATKLFLKYGYEGTSIRMILNDVGGEVGMFYHYFSSKQELFDKVFEHFMNQQGIRLNQILSTDITSETPYHKLEQIIICFAKSMEDYRRLSDGNIHWSILSALHELTVCSLQPIVKDLINKLCDKCGIGISIEIDWVTAFLLKGVSGLLHEESFLKLPHSQQLQTVIELICRTLKIPQEIFENV